MAISTRGTKKLRRYRRKRYRRRRYRRAYRPRTYRTKSFYIPRSYYRKPYTPKRRYTVNYNNNIYSRSVATKPPKWTTGYLTRTMLRSIGQYSAQRLYDVLFSPQAYTTAATAATALALRPRVFRIAGPHNMI